MQTKQQVLMVLGIQVTTRNKVRFDLLLYGLY